MNWNDLEPKQSIPFLEFKAEIKQNKCLSSIETNLFPLYEDALLDCEYYAGGLLTLASGKYIQNVREQQFPVLSRQFRLREMSVKNVSRLNRARMIKGLSWGCAEC